MSRINRGGLWYTIDDRGRAIPEIPLPTAARPATTEDVPRVGRTNLVLSSNLQKVDTILDWRSEDSKARAVRLVLGRPDRESKFGIQTSPPLLTPGETYLMYPIENQTQGILGVGRWIKYNVCALVEFGIEGHSDQMVIDAVPAQSVSLIASFIRVVGFNNSAAVEDIEFQAAVAPDNGYPQVPARLTVNVQGRENGGGAFLPGGEARIPVPRFAKAVRITRGHDSNTPNAPLVVTLSTVADTIPDPGAGASYTVTYEGNLPEVIFLNLGATSNAFCSLVFDIQP